MSDPHAHAVRLATYALLKLFPADRFTISCQCPMRLGESRPLPDIVIVPGTPREIARHPTSALLVIEVSDMTLEFDRTEKAALYARNLLPDYWDIDLNARSVEVFRKPGRLGDQPAVYSSVQPFGVSETIAPLAAPESAIVVADLLP